MPDGVMNIPAKDTEGWSVLPLFPDAKPKQLLGRIDSSRAYEDPFLQALLISRPIQRLREIGFLGALDYVLYGNGRSAHRRRHNRFEHSLGVARLAERFAVARKLSAHDRRILIAAGLLHDIGHGPLSHTLEPVFKDKFGITHHLLGRQIILGQAAIGTEISEAAIAYGVDLDEVLAMIEGTHDAPHAFIFASPINLDTIEGINRTSLFMSRNRTSLGAEELIDRIALDDNLPTRELDAFWSLKNEVYNLFIHAPRGLLFDGLAQAYMMREIGRFTSRDFLKTEPQLRYREPTLFHIFSWARISQNRLHVRATRLGEDFLDFNVMAPKREFGIREDIPLQHTSDLWLRYAQSRGKRRRSVRDILALSGEGKA